MILTDAKVRALILELWKRIEDGVAIHCGGHGLVVGCPVCGRRFK